jgi:TetR/AcrR family transcriptional repressor of mexJK operon
MRQWSPDNAKAALMKKKQDAIISAARAAFLQSGYAETSMDSIARAAKVGIKTVYRHFKDKDDLFIAVMQAACLHHGEGTHDKETPPWFSLGPSVGVQVAAETYLRSILAEDQIALFRVMIRDAHKFPELGQRYQQEVIETRNKLFIRYLEQWRKREGWKLANPERAAIIFAALLRSDIFENALLGLRMPSEREMVNHAKATSSIILFMLKHARL